MRPELPEGVERPDLPAAAGPPRWPLWSPFAALLLTVVIALAGVSLLAVVVELAGAEVDPGDPSPGITIGGTVIQDLALIVSALIFARVTAGRPSAREFGLRWPRLGPAVGWTLVTWLAFFVFSAVWAAALNITEEDDLPTELGADESTAALVAVIVLVTVIAPVTEEFFFRGFLFPAVRSKLGLLGGVLVTGVIFGAIHAGGTSAEFLVPLAFLGGMLCLLYTWTGSLLPCMVLHALNNSLALGVSQDWNWQVPVLMAASSAVILALARPVVSSRRLNARALPA